MVEDRQLVAPLSSTDVAELAEEWGLHPELALRCALLWFECKRAGFTVGLESGWRSTDLQRRLYQAWLDRGKRGLPAAPPGRSKHERTPAEATDWRIPPGHVHDFGAIAERVGLKWGGRFSTPDPVHVELP